MLLVMTQGISDAIFGVMKRLPLIVSAALLAACASSQPAGDPATRPEQTRTNPNLLTEAELATNQAPNALVAIQQLRPTWLRGRGATMSATGEQIDVVVYLNSVRVGTVRELEQISRTTVKEMQFFSPADATTRWGTGHSRGAITVTTK